METVHITTSDSVALVGDYFEGTHDAGALLLHMMPATRSSWNTLAPKLLERGLHVLTIDLRGHGESDGGPDGYNEFTDKEHRESRKDVEAGIAFLQEKGIAKGKITIIGASIGANLALQYISEHKEGTDAVLLSAGFTYKGIETLPLMASLQAGQRVFIAGSEDDQRSSGGTCADMAIGLGGGAPSGVEAHVQTYKTAGHGTDMFRKEKPDLEAGIIQWIKA